MTTQEKGGDTDAIPNQTIEDALKRFPRKKKHSLENAAVQQCA